MPPNLQEPLSQHTENRIITVEDWGHCGNNRDATTPNLRDSSAEVALELAVVNLAQLAENRRELWRARRDSNSRPIAPEAIALSS